MSALGQVAKNYIDLKTILHRLASEMNTILNNILQIMFKFNWAFFQIKIF